MKLFRRPSSGPLWQEEFSVFTADERYVTRRQLTKFLTLTSLAMFAGSAWIALRAWLYRAPAYPRTAIAGLDEVPVGGVKLFDYPSPGEPCILVRRAADSLVAYSQKCTHLSCTVYYSRERDRLECPCHKGVFSVGNGDALEGPPRRPLPRVRLEQRGGQWIAAGMEEGGKL
jgi:Rieske Fe-S protein